MSEKIPKLVILNVDGKIYEALDYGTWMKILEEYKPVKENEKHKKL